MEEENIMDYSNNIKKGDIFYVAYAKDYINGDTQNTAHVQLISLQELRVVIQLAI